MCRVSSEYFAISGDVYIILGLISESDYVCPTPDGRGKDPGSARERLARVVCADAEMLGPESIDQMAIYIMERQVQQITEALSQVLSALEESYISLK
ncbi:(4-(4-[2-(gamma-L-glutamylamino) ethyl]phenoxymethyl)furan-2-yl)methanamine synthase [Candidatus Hakubella thermalkaliphila]|nr:(4-(4-[2-(gamma-L-glutamylamino) ethyl]phenoxymethyl)furan-2-yl)methanamine synthase [Candidatus Hakubella thermalkaliphila]